MNYYYMDNQNREIGPVSLENLKAFRISDVIKDHTLVRLEGGGPWTACVAVVGAAVAPALGTPSPAAAIVSSAVRDARAGLAMFLANPVGGLAPTYQQLGSSRARAAGIVFAAATALLWVVLVYLTETFKEFRPGTFGGFLKLLLVTAGSLFSWMAVLAVTRKISCREAGGFEKDIFIAGAVSLGWATACLLLAILGWKNFEVCGAVLLAAVCVTVLQFFTGLTRISGLNERAATLAVPLILIAGTWLTKIIFMAVYG